jgi:hypothetical protein
MDTRLFPGARRPGREADHSLPSSSEERMSGATPPLPNTPLWRGSRLRHRDYFTFIFTLPVTIPVETCCSKIFLFFSMNGHAA